MRKALEGNGSELFQAISRGSLIADSTGEECRGLYVPCGGFDDNRS